MFARKTALERAQALWHKGETDRAITVLREALGEDPRQADLLVQLVRWHHQRQEPESAARRVTELASVLGVDPGAVPPPMPSQTSDLLRPMIADLCGEEIADATAGLLLLLAQQAERRGEVNTAGKAYRQALQVDANLQPATFGLGRCLLALGAYESALPLIETWIETWPDRVEYYQLGAQCAAALGQTDLANDFRHGWLLFDPSRDELLEPVGLWLHDRGQREAMIELYEVAIHTSPTDETRLNVLGNVHLELFDSTHKVDHLERACTLLRRSLSVQPRQSDIEQIYAEARRKLLLMRPDAAEDEDLAPPVADDDDPLKALDRQGIFE